MPNLRSHHVALAGRGLSRLLLGLFSVLLLAMGCSGGSGGLDAPHASSPAVVAIESHARLAERLTKARVPWFDDGQFVSVPTDSGRSLSTRVDAVDGTTRLSSDRGDDAWIEILPAVRLPQPALLHDAAIVFENAALATDVVIVMEDDRVEEFRVLHGPEAPTTATYRIRHGAGVDRVELADGIITAHGADGRILSRTTTPYAVDAEGTPRPIELELERDANGHLLLHVSVSVDGAVFPVVVDPQWQFGAGWPQPAITALNSVVVGPDGVVEGDVAVLDAAPGPTLDVVEAVVLDQAFVSGDVYADEIEIIDGVVDGTAYANEIVCQQCNDDDLPLPGLPLNQIPGLVVDAPGHPNFMGGTGAETWTSSTWPAAGDYGDVTVASGAVVFMGGGLYHFKSLTLQNQARVRPIGAAELRVEERLVVEDDARLVAGFSDDLEVFVTAFNDVAADPLSQPEAVSFGADTFFYGRLFAPNGTVTIGEGAIVDGRVVARDVNILEGAYVEADSEPLAPNCEQYCSAVLAAGCSQGPQSQGDCELQCEAELSAGYCQHQTQAFVTCVAAAQPAFSCDSTGYPVIASPRAGCVNLQSELDTCQSVCSAADDSNPCTTDACQCTAVVCNTVDSIQHAPAPYGTDCGDGDPCTGDELCDGTGTCLAGTPPDEDDGNPCTDDGCIAGQGVVHLPVEGVSCSDGDACNGAELCDASGVCQPGTPQIIDDGDPLTIDTCDPIVGTPAHAPVPPLDESIATNIYDASKHLFEDPDPTDGIDVPQQGVSPGAIEPARMAIIRGRVEDAAGNPIPGVTISILQPPSEVSQASLGSTFSQGDGWFEMAVNGGDLVTVRYDKPGLLSVQRSVMTYWLDYSVAPTVVMTPRQASGTTIDFATSTSQQPQIARGDVTADIVGTRQATLLFEPGTTAQMEFADGTSQVLTAGVVRVTEFTVGPSGPAAMPGTLPAASAYTHAFNASIDEAEALGATHVTFNQPVSYYIENFYDAPVGTIVPLGYYNHLLGRWDTVPGGLVAKHLGDIDADGRADLDLDGDDLPDPEAHHDAIGLTDAERHQLLSLYPAGTQLWRVQLEHFSDPDPNFAGEAPGDACEPNGDGCEAGKAVADNATSDPDCTSGSIIECQNQVLGQRLPIPGTPYSLHYRSDRTRGARARYRLDIPVVGDQLPPSTEGLIVEIHVAGRRFEERFDCKPSPEPECSPNSSWTFEWDGLDHRGREHQGPQVATVRIGYTYKVLRTSLPPTTGVNFTPGGGGGGGGLGGTTMFTGGNAMPFAEWLPDTDKIHVEKYVAGGVEWWTFAAMSDPVRIPIGAWRNKPSGLGGWSIDVHHGYAPIVDGLFRGDGRWRYGSEISPSIDPVAGDPLGSNGNPVGDPATTWLPGCRGLGVAANGSTYLACGASSTVSSVLELSPAADALSIVAGANGGDHAGHGDSGDDGPATAARLHVPHDVAVAPDGTLYVADSANHRVRRIDTDGVITTLAGTGQVGDAGPYALAVDAAITNPQDIAIGPSGAVFFIEDTANPSYQRIRKLSPGGLLSTVVGGGTHSADGVHCINHCDPVENPSCMVGGACPDKLKGFDMQAQMHGLAVAKDGSLFFTTNGDCRVWQVTPTGDLVAFAGSGTCYPATVGTSRTNSNLGIPRALAVAPSGVYVVVEELPTGDPDEYGVLYIDSNDAERPPERVLGGGCDTSTGQPCGLDAFAVNAGLPVVWDVAVHPDGSLLVMGANQLYRATPPQGAPPGATKLVPSQSGAEVYEFVNGRHSKTYDAVLGTTLYSFGYDPTGRLTTITDIDGRQTTITHGANGPLQLEGPDGHTLGFDLDPSGMLSVVAYPDGGKHAFSYTNGRLESYHSPNAYEANPSGSHKEYHYGGSDFYLTSATGPDGWSKALVRTDIEPGHHSIQLTDALGLFTTYTLEQLSTGGFSRTVTPPSGVTTTIVDSPEGGSTQTEVDQTVTTRREGLDPRFGPLAPIPSVNVQTAGLTVDVSADRSVVYADPENPDPLAIDSLTETLTVNGRTSTTVIDNTATPATVTTTTASPQRITVTKLDAQGRPIEITPPGVEPVTLTYYTAGPDAGRLHEVIRAAGQPDERRATYAYEAGNLVSIVNALNETTTFEHDAVGRVTATVFPDGERVRLGYDYNGNVTTLAQPGSPGSYVDADVHRFAFTALDLVDNYDPPGVAGLSLDVTDYTYESGLRLDQVDLPGTPSPLAIDQTYDPTTGQLTTISTPTDTLTLSYFPLGDAQHRDGKLQSLAASADSVTITYDYDDALPKSVAWSGPVTGTVSRTYNADLQVATEAVDGQAIVYQYVDDDALLTHAGAAVLARNPATGAIDSVSVGSVVDTFTPNTFGELAQIASAHSGTALYDALYERDALGRITQKTETLLSGIPVIRGYEYDARGRLWKVWDGDCTPGPCTLLAEYLYDANGNRTSVALNGGSPVISSYDEQDRLENDGAGTTYAYTNDGRLASTSGATGTTTYTYDELGALRTVTPPSGPAIDYIIDGTGRRIGKKVNGTLERGWLYRDALNPVAELDPNGNVTARFVYGSRPHVPDYMIKGGSTYRLVTDHLGAVRLVIDGATGTVAQRIDYDAWGTVVSDTSPGFQPFGFAGGFYDPGTGLVRFGARDYHPAIGRWTAKDPIHFAGGGANLYAYVGANPLNSVDPSGLKPVIFDVGVSGGMLFGVGGGIAFGHFPGDGWHLYGYGQFGLTTPGAEVHALLVQPENVHVPEDYSGPFYSLSGSPGYVGFGYSGWGDVEAAAIGLTVKSPGLAAMGQYYSHPVRISGLREKAQTGLFEAFERATEGCR